MNMNSNSLVIKSHGEIQKIRKACEISAAMHLALIKTKTKGRKEIHLAQKLQAKLSEKTSLEWAYPPIIGSGERATILHARPTTKVIKDNDLVLVDAGVKYDGFCSDITRTWPSTGTFSNSQKTIYQIVLSAQKSVLKGIRPGVTLNQLHEICHEVMLEGLRSAGILRTKEITTLYPHKTSHWIGKKVHDPCAYFNDDGKPVLLSAGMCFTVEPGLYFKDLYPDYQGIGVRIEDVVVVSETSCEVLSLLPKELEEIEELRRKANE